MHKPVHSWILAAHPGKATFTPVRAINLAKAGGLLRAQSYSSIERTLSPPPAATEIILMLVADLSKHTDSFSFPPGHRKARIPGFLVQSTSNLLFPGAGIVYLHIDMGRNEGNLLP